MQLLTVTAAHTAEALGSGTLPVFATPALVAFMENTAMKQVEGLAKGETTVGIDIKVQHLKASAVGERLWCTATIVARKERKISFEITVINEQQEVVGTATHDRFVVDGERFMSRLR